MRCGPGTAARSTWSCGLTGGQCGITPTQASRWPMKQARDGHADVEGRSTGGDHAGMSGRGARGHVDGQAHTERCSPRRRSFYGVGYNLLDTARSTSAGSSDITASLRRSWRRAARSRLARLTATSCSSAACCLGREAYDRRGAGTASCPDSRLARLLVSAGFQ
jgi:hypothetical protein